MVPTIAHKYIEISLYTQSTPACFGRPCGNLQGCRIQSLLSYFTSLKMTTCLAETCRIYSCAFVDTVTVYTQILFEKVKFEKIIDYLLELGICSSA